MCGIHTTTATETAILCVDTMSFGWHTRPAYIASLSKEESFILTNICFTVHKKDTISIMGITGSGKTSLAKILCGRIAPTIGTVYFYGHRLVYQWNQQSRQQRIAIQMVPQAPSLSFNPLLSIKKSVRDAYTAYQYVHQYEHNGHTRQQRNDGFQSQLQHICEVLQLPLNLLDRLPHELSGGQLQRFALARAILASPDVLILDEPVSFLDLDLRKTVLDLIIRLQEETGVALIVISHLEEVCKYLRGRTFVLEQRTLIEKNTPDPKNPHE